MNMNRGQQLGLGVWITLSHTQHVGQFSQHKPSSIDTILAGCNSHVSLVTTCYSK